MDLLKELCEASGAPGFEGRVRDIFRREIAPLVDRIEVDGLGNVIAIREAAHEGAPKVMLAGHMDEIGFVVSHVDDNGFVRLVPLGGFDPKTLVAQRVRISGHAGQDLLGVIGSKPIHILSADERKKAVEIKDLFVDCGRPAAEVKALVELGDPVTLDQSFEVMGDALCCKAMDNRVSIWTLIRALERVESREVAIYAVATAQEEVGLRGALTASHRIQPDLGIAIDVTLACDVPSAKPEQHISKLGSGVAIKLLDSASISTPRLVSAFRELAREQGIPHQMEILPRGGTDAGGIQRGGDAVPAITLSVPTRYVHTVVEMIHRKDLEATVDLLVAFLERAHEVDLAY